MTTPPPLLHRLLPPTATITRPADAGPALRNPPKLDPREPDPRDKPDDTEAERKHHHRAGDADAANGMVDSLATPAEPMLADVAEGNLETPVPPPAACPSPPVASPPWQRRAARQRRHRAACAEEEAQDDEPLDLARLTRLADSWLFTEARPDLQPWVARAEALLDEVTGRPARDAVQREQVRVLEHYLSVARAQRHALNREPAPPRFPAGAGVDDILRISGWRRHVLEDELIEHPDLFCGTVLEHPLDATRAGLRRLLEDGPTERPGRRARECQQMEAALACMRPYAESLMQAGLRDALQRALHDMAAMTAFLRVAAEQGETVACATTRPLASSR